MRLAPSLLSLSLSLSLGVMSCAKTTTIECADGRVCPSGTVCDLIGATCVAPGGLSVDARGLDLGTVACGTSATTQLGLSNFGDEPIVFVASSTLPIITISPAEGVVDPGGRLSVAVTLDASVEELPVGLLEAAITFTTKDEVMPHIVSATISGALIDSNVTAIDFGIAALDQLPSPQTLSITNDGSASIDFSAATTDLPFAVDVNNAISVEPSATKEVSVSFDPTFTGEYTGDLALSYDGPLCKDAVERIALSGEISDAAVLVNSRLVDFGTTPCKVPARSQTLIFSSNSADPQTLSFEFSGTNDAYELPAQAVLPVGGQAQVTARLNAIETGSPGSIDANVAVTASPSGESFDITLQHMLEAPLLTLNPATLDFGSVSFDTETTAQFTVFNGGNAPTQVKINPSRFDLGDGIEGNISPDLFTLGINDSQTITIAIKTQEKSGEFSGSAKVEADGECNGPLGIRFSGVVDK